MELIDEPSRKSYALPARMYRVTFWQKQLPPPGTSYSPDEMAWSALHFDLAGAEDVHEVLEWAEAHFDENTTDESDRGVEIGLWTPDGLLSEPTLVQIAGFKPTVEDATYNLRPRPITPPAQAS